MIRGSSVLRAFSLSPAPRREMMDDKDVKNIADTKALYSYKARADG